MTGSSDGIVRVSTSKSCVQNFIRGAERGQLSPLDISCPPSSKL